jgi:hypothetical protein
MKNQYKTKTKVNYSIDQEISKVFDTLSKEKSINKSALIENFIKNWIKENS